MLSALNNQHKLKRFGPLRRRISRRLSPRLVIGAIVVIAIGALIMNFFSSERGLAAAKSYSMLITSETHQILINVRPGALTLANISGAVPERPEKSVVFDIPLDVEDLKRIVDAMGGILINLPETIEYRGADGLNVRIDAGMRKLDADKVEAYFRAPNASKVAVLRAIVIGVASRAEEIHEEGGDLARLLDAALEPSAKGEDGANPVRLAGLLRASAQLGPAEIMIDWAAPARESPSPGPPPEAARSTIRIRILNGIGTPRLAARAASRLRAPNFSIVETANADRFGYAATVVRSTNSAAAQEIRDALGLGTIESRDVAAGADVEIILGADARDKW